MRSLFVSLCISVVCAVSAQHPFLSRFTADQVDDGVFLEWTMSAGNTCLGISIEHALPGEEFQEVGFIEGICGQADASEDFTFFHDAPESGTVNRYRLLLGLSGYTEEITIRFLDLREGLVLFYRPDEEVIHITGPQHTQGSSVSIYDHQGRLVQQVGLDGSSTQVQLGEWNSGLYFVSLSSSTSTVVGSFIKF